MGFFDKPGTIRIRYCGYVKQKSGVVSREINTQSIKDKNKTNIIVKNQEEALSTFRANLRQMVDGRGENLFSKSRPDAYEINPTIQYIKSTAPGPAAYYYLIKLTNDYDESCGRFGGKKSKKCGKSRRTKKHKRTRKHRKTRKH